MTRALELSELIGTVIVCAGPPVCLLRDKMAVAKAQAGCAYCKRIGIYEDGTELIEALARH